MRNPFEAPSKQPKKLTKGLRKQIERVAIQTGKPQIEIAASYGLKWK